MHISDTSRSSANSQCQIFEPVQDGTNNPRQIFVPVQEALNLVHLVCAGRTDARGHANTKNRGKQLQVAANGPAELVHIPVVMRIRFEKDDKP
jgi:hypothetical protein